MEKFDIEKYNKNPNRPIIDEEGASCEGAVYRPDGEVR